MRKLFVFLSLFLISGLLLASSFKPNKIDSYSYGPTKVCDNLWQIALSVSHKHSDITPQQTMLAILNYNPKAFYKKNVNGLMRGYVLSIPPTNQIQKISRKSADKIIKKQYRNWRRIIEEEMPQNPSDSLIQLRKHTCPPKNIAILIKKTISPKSNGNAIASLKNTQLHQEITNLKNQISALIKSNQNQLLYIKYLMLERQKLLLQNKQLSQYILQLQQKLAAANQKIEQTFRLTVPTIKNIIHNFKLRTLSPHQAPSPSTASTASTKTKWLQDLFELDKKKLAQFIDLHRKDMQLWLIIVAVLAALAFIIGFIFLLSARRSSKQNKPQVTKKPNASPPAQPEIKKTKPLNYNYIAGEDVVTAKLDLARAYIDMEDYENAEKILQDVTREGNAKQKEDAKNLLEKFSKLKKQ